MAIFRSIYPTLLALLFCLGGSVDASETIITDANFDKAVIGQLTDSRIEEASGMASSAINSNILWLLNDSGNSPALFAVTETGTTVAKLKIKGIENKDWEDLARFEYQGLSYLLIADVGDNRAKRSNYQLHAILEPKLPQKVSQIQKLTISPSWTISFTYEDGARDCESVAVDQQNGRVLLLSKRDTPPVLYQLPLFPLTWESNQQLIAKRIGEIPPLPKISQDNSFFLFDYSAQPTAMDILPNNNSIAVLTYDGAFLFSKTDGKPQSWFEVLSSKPELLTPVELKQAEAIAFSADGKSIYITSEKLPAPIIKLSEQ